MAWILQVDQRQKKKSRQDTLKRYQLNHGNKKLFYSENKQILQHDSFTVQGCCFFHNLCDLEITFQMQSSKHTHWWCAFIFSLQLESSKRNAKRYVLELLKNTSTFDRIS